MGPEARKARRLNDTPGMNLARRILRRHANDIGLKKTQYLSKARSQVSERDIRQWFARTKEILKRDQLEDILADPSRIFNCDETAVYLNPQGGKFIAEKGKAAVRVNDNDDKTNITVLFTVSASGDYAPPFILFKYKRMPKNICENVPDHWGVSCNESGWMTAEKFFGYVTNIFHPYLERNNIERPVILFMDGHTSHLSLPMSEFCVQNGIILICLIASATHILQPLDVAFFRPLKVYWRQHVRLYRMKNKHDIQKQDVAKEIEVILQENEPKLRVSIQHGFKRTGLYPFDADAVNYEKHLLRKETDSSSTSVDSPKKFTRLQIFESVIPPDIFKQFQQCKRDGNWNGEYKFKSLFDLWLDLHNKEESYDEFIEYDTVKLNCSCSFVESQRSSTSIPALNEFDFENENSDPDEPLAMLNNGADSQCMINNSSDDLMRNCQQLMDIEMMDVEIPGSLNMYSH